MRANENDLGFLLNDLQRHHRMNFHTAYLGSLFLRFD